MGTDTRTLEALANREYKWGFVTDTDADAAPKGLNEDIIRLISTKKNEPEFMLEWRLKAYGYWSKLEKEQAEPKWANIKYGPIDYQDIVYYSAPKSKKKRKRGGEDPCLSRTSRRRNRARRGSAASRCAIGRGMAGRPHPGSAACHSGIDLRGARFLA